MKRMIFVLALTGAALPLAGCVVYEPVPTAAPQPSPQQRFDRSWNAAAGAMADQGVTIFAQDRGAGVIRGSRGGITVSATLTTLADGSVQVKFGSTGATDTDPGLLQRVSQSYERRMGR
jgi:hypothetical protein